MQQNDNFRLVVRRGPQPNQVFEIIQEVTTLGRDISNDIVLNDRETSRHHLRLMRSGDTMTIEDLGSTNGTFVNGKRVSGVTPLQNGDMIGLGETVTLALEAYSSLAEAVPSSTPITPATPPPLSTDMPAPGSSAEQGYTPPPTDYGPPSQGAPAEPYMPPAADVYPPPQPAYPGYSDQPPAQQSPGPYQDAPAGYNAPPAPPGQYPGYDYDPYAAREESGGTSPWLILGCFVFFVLVFVCFAGIALTVIDVLNLWCEVPVIVDVVRALSLGC